jgi:hypothetical protein
MFMINRRMLRMNGSRIAKIADIAKIVCRV